MSRSHRRHRVSCPRAGAPHLEPLEERTLFSTAVMGFLQDWKIASGASAQPMFSETSTSNGTISSDELNWSALTQVNYFSLRPNADGSLETLGNGDIESASGEDVNIQLPPIVAEAHAKNADTKVFVTVGGGDGASITAMTALIDANQTAWTNFANQMQSFVSTYGVSGVDLDWEPDSATKAEFDNFGTLIATLKSKGLTVSADVLSDPRQVTGTSQTAYVLNDVAIQNLDTINVMAYASSSESEADGYVAQWKTYLSGGTDVDGTTVNAAVSKLQYGIDDIDDTYNTAAVVKGKVDTTLSNGYGGVFLWDLNGDTNSTDIDAIGSEIVAQGGTIGGGTGSTGTGGTGTGGTGTTTTPTTGTISGTVTTSAGAPVVGATIFVDSNDDGVLDDGEISAVTDASGAYTLSDVPAGIAVPVQQVAPSGYTQISGPIQLTVTAGVTDSNEDFVDSAPTSTTTGGGSSTASPLTATVRSTTLPTDILQGTRARGNVVVTVANPGSSAVHGPMTIELYATSESSGATPVLIGSLTRTLTIGANKQISVSVPVQSLPTTAANIFRLSAMVIDPNKDTASSAAGPVVNVDSPYVQFSDKLISTTLPRLGIAGASTKAVARVEVTNIGNVTSSGQSTITIYVSPDNYVSDGTVIRSVTESLVIKAGGSRVVTVPLQTLPSVAAGSYGLIAVATPPSGAIASSIGSQNITLAEPVISLVPSAASVVTQRNGTGTLSFTLTNNGNVASGPSTLMLESNDGTVVVETTVLTETLPTLAAGRSRVQKMHLTAAQVTALESEFNQVLSVTDSNDATESTLIKISGFSSL